MKYLINLAYNGNDFYGYQIQNEKLTVEGELEKCLSKILNTKINTIASSRTDRGVHALNQYCTFEYDKKINLKKLTHSINSIINNSIFIKKIKRVNEEFNVRYDVIKKTYIYKINIGKYNPIEKDYVLQYNKKIEKNLLDDFILKMNGEHNFKSFTSDKDNNNYIRDIMITYKIRNNILYLRFESTGFLRYMIRNIVGLLLDINERKKSITDIDEIFKLEDRKSIGTCVAGMGLYLESIIFK
jgi:tRNA pseudouridine38-40 synthase